MVPCCVCKFMVPYRVSKGMYGKCSNEKNQYAHNLVLLLSERTKGMGCIHGEVEEVRDGECG